MQAQGIEPTTDTTMTLWHASLDLHQTAVGYLAATAMESLRLASEAGKGEIGLDTSG